MLKDTNNFLWGAAISAYQAEGGNVNADWWEWEKLAGKENSGQAARHYERYEEDFDLAKSLYHNAHRLSIEWSRVEPREGEFSEKELEHYIKVIQALRSRGIEPIVTLHHFTNPAWLAKLGGWEKKLSIKYFLRYCDRVVRRLGRYVHYWITINEPTIYLSHCYLFGAWPPQKRSYLKAKAVESNLLSGHIKAYRLLHKTYKELGFGQPVVSIAQYTQSYVAGTPSLKDRLAAYFMDKWFNFGFLNKAMRYKTLDFVGINYYKRQVVGKNRIAPAKKNSLGWDIYPQGLYEILLKAGQYRRPVIITENGICTADDDLRWEYIRDHLESVRRAKEKGVVVAGYLYWSLIDNFEWDKGFVPRFGLIDIDYATYKRTVRQSAIRFGDICKAGFDLFRQA